MISYILLIILFFIYKSVTAFAMNIDFSQSLKDIGVMTLLLFVGFLTNFYISKTIFPIEIVIIAVILIVYYMYKNYGKDIQKKDMLFDTIILPPVFVLYMIVFYYLRTKKRLFIRGDDRDNYDKSLDDYLDDIEKSTPVRYRNFMSVY